MDTTSDFPMHDGGKVLFQRDWFIKKTASFLLAKDDSGKHRSHYWRAPFGAGKTLFLKLIGRELQKRGCDVYMTVAAQMDDFDYEFFPKLAKEAGDRTVVLMVDEVQNNMNSKHWNRVLKGSKPANLLVLGAGIPQLDGFTPQFDERYPEGSEVFPMFLTIDDLPEVRAHFITRTNQSEEITAKVCERLLEFTAGHLFAFVRFTTHVLDPSSGIDLRNLDSYLVSEKFSISTVYQEVQERCLASLTGSMLTVARGEERSGES